MSCLFAFPVTGRSRTPPSFHLWLDLTSSCAIQTELIPCFTGFWATLFLTLYLCIIFSYLGIWTSGMYLVLSREYISQMTAQTDNFWSNNPFSDSQWLGTRCLTRSSPPVSEAGFQALASSSVGGDNGDAGSGLDSEVGGYTCFTIPPLPPPISSRLCCCLSRCCPTHQLPSLCPSLPRHSPCLACQLTFLSFFWWSHVFCSIVVGL